MRHREFFRAPQNAIYELYCFWSAAFYQAKKFIYRLDGWISQLWKLAGKMKQLKTHLPINFLTSRVNNFPCIHHLINTMFLFCMQIHKMSCHCRRHWMKKSKMAFTCKWHFLCRIRPCIHRSPFAFSLSFHFSFI